MTMKASQPIESNGRPQQPSCDGLAGVVAASTALSHVDGAGGELVLKGHRVDSLAPSASFEELIELFLETTDVASRMAGHRTLPPATLDLLEANRDADPMDALRMAVASLASGTESPTSTERTESALRLLAKLPTIVASHHHFSCGRTAGGPSNEPGLAADFLHQLSSDPLAGRSPSPARTRALETYLNTVSDHGMNASTFTARVIISTESDLISAVTGALGALKGPLHGGAPGPALDMVFEIAEPSRARSFLEAKLDRGERLMGFGHRVYKVRDPRADVLAAAAVKLARSGENQELYDLATAVERTALEVLAERKPERRLDTNVEYYTALLLHAIGLNQDQFTPTFAIGRCVGWIAHCFEQLDYGRLIRPESIYVGPPVGSADA